MAWHTAWEQAVINPQYHQMLNPYFIQCMRAMLDCLYDDKTMTSGTLIAFSNSVNTTLESCDYVNLKSELFSTCENIFSKIKDLEKNQQLLQNMNKE